MKKAVLLLVIMLVSAGLFAEVSEKGLSFGLSTGVSYDTEDVSELEDYNVSTIGVPVSVEVLYSLGNLFEVPGQGDIRVDVGLKAGYLHLVTASKSPVEFNAFTIPVLAYGKATMGNFFVGLGLGVHAWNVNYDYGVYDGGENGIDFCALIEPGYEFSINNNLSVLGSFSIYNTAYEMESGEAEATVIKVNIGVHYAL